MKKILAIAIAALPAAAMADVEIYGKITAEIANTKTSSATAASSGEAIGSVPTKSLTQINNAGGPGSHIGFRGNEDLGGGLKAIWQIEQAIDFTQTPGGANNTFATRDSFVGLQSDTWGKIRLGRLSNYPNSNMEFVDPWTYDNNTNVNGSFIFTRLDSRVNQAIRYDSPAWSGDWGGFSFAALYGFNEPGTNAVGKKKQNTANVGLTYTYGPYTAAYSYLTQQNQRLDAINGNPVSGRQDANRFEASYNANNLYVAIGYQETKGYGGNIWPAAAYWAGTNQAFENTPDKYKTQEAELTVQYTIGNWTPGISYGHGWNMKKNGETLDNSGYNMFVVGTNYALSKRTNAYLSYGQVKYDRAIDVAGTERESTVGLGISHSF